MKKKLYKIMITLMIILTMPIVLFANTLTLYLSVNKETIKVGDKFTVKVEWNQGMQAADFYLEYDNEKISFVKANIEDDFTNEDNGKLRTAWFSMDDTDKTEIEYTFKAKKAGQASISTKINGGFANGDLEIPTNYQEGNIIINIQAKSIIIQIIKVVAVFIVLWIIFIMMHKVKKNKKPKSKKQKSKKDKDVQKYFK